jgi:hypothetical protein
MTDPPSLFDVLDDLPQQDQPRCPMCAKTRRWNPRRNEWARYCGGQICNNPDRVCRTCGEQFEVNVDGAGTKYCSTACKRVGYTISQQRTTALVRCVWCDAPAPSAAGAYRAMGYICPPCVEPLKFVIGRLYMHHVSLDRITALLTNPCCDTCGKNITIPVRHPVTNTVRAPLVVDHDHACCPGRKSCGKCVRGLLCNGCNAALGLAAEDPKVLRTLADYIERAKNA